MQPACSVQPVSTGRNDDAVNVGEEDMDMNMNRE